MKLKTVIQSLLNTIIPERPIFLNCCEDFSIFRIDKNHNRFSLEKIRKKGEVNVGVSVYTCKHKVSYFYQMVH